MRPLANLALVAAEPTRHCAALDQSSFGGGNITGGLSTIEEKSIGAYAKSGTNPIARHAAPGRATAAARPVSHGHGAGRLDQVGVREHQRQRHHRRADRLRRAHRAVLDGPRLADCKWRES
jgi:D-galactarate dehydratase / Altronate hydrolase, C terminus